ncbi:MAG: alpha/beta hydrolase, partial [Acidimicrobiia bacterium]|nr:alpha/beta hydrolase [Acidimicrobiia bacterium]
VPVLALLGELDAELSGAEVRRIADQVPGAEVRTVPGAARLPSLERPDLVAGAVRELLGRR